MLERLFKLSERGTTAGTEVLAGVTTFMTMAYIIFVNPIILSDAFVDRGAGHLVGSPGVTTPEVMGALFIATCIAAAVGSLIMAFAANLPVALAPGMGMNAFFVGLVVAGKVPWQVALGIVFISGVVFLALSLVRFRETVMAAVPDAIKFGAAAGIGLFIGFIGLQHARVVVPSQFTMVTLGDLSSPPTLLALFGLAATAVLLARKVPGAIFLGLGATGIAGLATGIVPWAGLLDLSIPSPAPIFLKLDIVGALSVSCIVPILTFLFFDLFDTVGTLMGVGEEAGLMVEGRLPNAEKALAADAGASVVGSLFGTSTVTSYIESAAGVAAGGRTGLASVVTGVLFIAAIILVPLVSVFGNAVLISRGEGVPPVFAYPVTAPALIIVGYLMCGALKKIDWSESTEALPAFLTVALMPLTYSISAGLAAGFVSYSILKIATGRAREAHWIVHLVAWALVVVYVFIRLTGSDGG